MSIKAGAFYEHIRSGVIYKALMVTNEMAESNNSFKVTVVYDDIHCNLWSRPLVEFKEKFKEV
jgi:hypothetical protein